MNILITGAAGYIGSSLTPYLQFLSAELNTYDNFYYEQGPLVYKSLLNTNFKKQDVLDWSDSLIDSIKNADVIIPLAAIVGAPACDKIPDYSTNINYRWYKKLLKHINKETLVITQIQILVTVVQGIVCVQKRHRLVPYLDMGLINKKQKSYF